MKPLDIEHKLDLIQHIHREQEKNERYVYYNLRQIENNGRYSDRNDYETYDRRIFANQKENVKLFSRLRLRIIIMFVMLVGFIIMDKKEISYKEIGSNEIIEYISENMEVGEIQKIFELVLDSSSKDDL